MNYRYRASENYEILRSYFSSDELNKVTRPASYSSGVFDCLTFIRMTCSSLSGYYDFLRGNIIKYLWRDKGSRKEDLAKAVTYWGFLIERTTPTEADYELFEKLCQEALKLDKQIPLLTSEKHPVK